MKPQSETITMQLSFKATLFISAMLPGLALIGSTAEAGQKIHFPCSKNKSDGRVLVDGPNYDNKLASLGYKKTKDKWGTVDYHIGYKVLSFQKVKDTDDVWAEGVCYFELIPR